MNKFTKSILAAAMMLAIPASSIAEEFTVDGIQYQTTSENTVKAYKWVGTGVTDIVIPETVSNGGITYTVSEIYGDIFWGSTLIDGTSVKVAGTIKKIPGYTFYDYAQLKTIELCEGVETIEYSGLGWCDNLTIVILPSTITDINNGLKDCHNMTDVYCYATVPPTADDAFSSRIYTNATLHIPAESEYAYSQAACWRQFHNVASISTGVEGIETEEGSFRVVAGGIEIEGRADIYAIDGRIAATTDGGFVALPAGLYIVRGAKVMVK